MTLKSFERQLLDLAFRTGAELTAPYVAYCLGLSIAATQRLLDALVRAGILDVEVLESGVLAYRLSGRVGGHPTRPEGVPARLFPQRPGRWHLWAALLVLPLLAAGGYMLGQRSRAHQVQQPFGPPHGVKHPSQPREREIRLPVPQQRESCSAVIPLEELMGAREVVLRSGRGGSELRVLGPVAVEVRCPEGAQGEDVYRIQPAGTAIKAGAPARFRSRSRREGR